MEFNRAEKEHPGGRVPAPAVGDKRKRVQQKGNNIENRQSKITLEEKEEHIQRCCESADQTELIEQSYPLIVQEIQILRSGCREAVQNSFCRHHGPSVAMLTVTSRRCGRPDGFRRIYRWVFRA